MELCYLMDASQRMRLYYLVSKREFIRSTAILNVTIVTILDIQIFTDVSSID